MRVHEARYQNDVAEVVVGPWRGVVDGADVGDARSVNGDDAVADRR